MNYSIQRCVKPPGLIIRALTYYVELNEKGLYLICLGKATAQPNVRDPLSAMIANKAVEFFDNRYEKEIQKNEELIKTKGLDEMVKTKHSYFLNISQISSFKTNILPDQTVKIQIKFDKKITLMCHPYYGRIAVAMSDHISKK